MNKDFEDIRPYTDAETVRALNNISRLPVMYLLSKYLFPSKPFWTLSKMLERCTGVYSFQRDVMVKAIDVIMHRSSHGFTFDGTLYLRDIKGKFLAMSNHRDITMDPALTQYMMFMSGLPTTDICVGNNLLSRAFVRDIMRCNRMITVKRGIVSRELYESSMLLSRYIRTTISEGNRSVWIAQKEGRAKDGLDRTAQGILKMLEMSGEKSFAENFKELNIVPFSISYEYEPCDALKAREIYISSTTKYIKKKGEDLNSIRLGITQQKGHVHMSVCKPLTSQEIEEAAALSGNDRFNYLRKVIDRRIIDAYKLWKTNYIAYDMLADTPRFSELYTEHDVRSFRKYMDKQLSKIEEGLDRVKLEDVFLHIYSNPVSQKYDSVAD